MIPQQLKALIKVVKMFAFMTLIAVLFLWLGYPTGMIAGMGAFVVLVLASVITSPEEGARNECKQ